MVKIHPSKMFASVMGTGCQLYEVTVNHNFGESARKYKVVAGNRSEAELAAERRWNLDFPSYSATAIGEANRIGEVDMVNVLFGLSDEIVNEMVEAISGR